MTIVLKGVFLEAIVVSVTAFLFWLPSTQTSTEWVTKPMGKVYGQVRGWAVKVWTSPGGHVRVATWAIAALIVGSVFLIPGLDAYQPEAVSVAFTVIVLNELFRYQSHLEYKQSIIRQMASYSNEFALDAVRIAKQEGWDKDGTLRRAALPQANLRGAILNRAHLEEAKMFAIHFEGANLIGSHLEDAYLPSAYLDGAWLIGAHLDYANLVDAHMKKARLEGAHLEGATLTGTHLEEAHLENATFDSDTWYDNQTVWPKGFDIPDIATNVDDASQRSER